MLTSVGKDGDKVHRYCRLARFKQTLDELIGMKGRVKNEVVEECEMLEGLEDVEKTWVRTGRRSANDDCRRW